MISASPMGEPSDLAPQVHAHRVAQIAPDFFLLRGQNQMQDRRTVVHLEVVLEDPLHLNLGLVTAPIFLRGQSQMQDRLGPEIRVQHPVIDLLQCADVLLILEVDWVDL